MADRYEKVIERLRRLRQLREEEQKKALEKPTETAGFFAGLEKDYGTSGRTQDANAQPPPKQPPQPIVVESGKMSKPHPIVISLIILLIGGVALEYVYHFTPTHNLVAFLHDLLSQYVQDPRLLYISTEFAPEFSIGVIFIFYLLATVRKGNVASAFSNAFYNIGWFMFVLAIALFLSYIAYVNLLSTGYFDQWICSGSVALNTVIKIDPKAAQRCLNTKQQAPPNVKTGITDVESVMLGSQFTGNIIPQAIPDETYTVPFTITNLDKDNSLSGVYVKGNLLGQIRVSKTSGQLEDKLIKLSPSTCSQDNPCSILPGASQIVSLQSDDPITFNNPSFAAITVYTRFPYEGFGKGEFYIAKTEADAGKINFAKPESGPGPVDVEVFFAPTYISTESSIAHVKMFVAAINKGHGLIEAKSMVVKRISTFNELGTATCAVPGFKDTFKEGQAQNFNGLEFTSQAQFVCDMEVHMPELQSKTSLNIPFRTIPFTATFEYNYRETTTDTVSVRSLS